MIKTFVLDTNVLIHDNTAIFSFADNCVVISMTTIEELDNLKKLRDEKGYNARTVTRHLDSLFRARKDVEKPIPIGEGTLRIVFNHQEKLPMGFEPEKQDNKILQTAMYLQHQGEMVIFVSKDLNARIKAFSLGIKTQDYEKEKVQFSSLYQGWEDLTVPAAKIDAFYQNKKLSIKEIGMENIQPNSYVIMKALEDKDKSAIARVDHRNKQLIPLASYQGDDIWGIRALNVQQRFAFDLLLDDKISIVTLVGSAGTGKTLLAVSSGLKCTLDEKAYKKILVARPIVPLGKDIGFLPGSKEEKLSVWMEPIFDNIYFLLSQNAEKSDMSMKEVKDQLNYLTESNLLELGAITYIRGRSIPQQYVIIDEAQNLTPHEIKTIVSRLGEKSKLIITGDPEQIDNPYLDSDSNGLTYLIDRFKGQEIFGHITLKKSERSTLASLAAELL